MNSGSSSTPKRPEFNGKVRVNKSDVSDKPIGTLENKLGKQKPSNSALVGEKNLVKGKNVISGSSSGSRFDVLNEEIEDMQVGDESQVFNKGSIDPAHGRKNALVEITNQGKDGHRGSTLRGIKGANKGNENGQTLPYVPKGAVSNYRGNGGGKGIKCLHKQPQTTGIPTTKVKNLDSGNAPCQGPSELIYATNVSSSPEINEKCEPKNKAAYSSWSEKTFLKRSINVGKEKEYNQLHIGEKYTLIFILSIAEEESLDPSSITRVDVWIRGHKNKDGKHLNEATSSTLKSVEERKSSDSQDNLMEDSLAKFFGPERRGQVRALGFGVTPSLVNVQIQSSGRVKELESLVRTQGQQIAELAEKIQEMSALLLKQSESGQKNGASDDTISSHICTSQSQQGSRTAQVNDKHEHSKCQLLHWYGDNIEEVVAEGSVASTDTNTKVHHVPLGRDFWRVWVDLVFNSEVILVRPTDEARTLGGVVGSTIAWPKSCIRLL
ncbi:hypothetical protein EZV62_000472 [Acer yangbiense]|uniref:DUF8039 domain-containing protein n=1 Tax=Acer yangbiense TaxID=1000413 RepID=A0A5C7IR84_9ROSI|nr:hypothetical protein EZV62_000472 [Acer yangbiense]